MKPNRRIGDAKGYLYFTSASILALVATFGLSALELPFAVKSAVFALIVTVYLAVNAFIYIYERRTAVPAADEKAPEQTPEQQTDPFTKQTEEKLQLLEEASEFFAASLKPADMFRLIAGRVGEIVPFATCALLLIDERKKHFKISQATGENAQLLKGLNIMIDEGLAGKALSLRRPQIDRSLAEDRKVFSRQTLNGLESAAAVPLVAGGEIFGVLQLFGRSADDFDRNSLLLLEAIGERIVPLLNGSLSFERNLSSALTDSLTNLPNERAFFLVLENQIAESQRLPEKRHLAVLVMDIKDFDELNKTYGHTVGDRILTFTAETIKSQLRQMDFLSRSMNDEFFAVLPTASREITEKIIRRIEKSFILDPFRISDGQKVNIGLNFGFASFNTDGETANQLLKIALLKKRQAKSFEDRNVLWFPKEFVN
jgi:diguanylate cyclase (GGDEF)-like protein